EKLDLVLRARGLLPRVHDEAVVDRGHRDAVDALRLDRVRILHEAGHVVAVAGRREGAGHSKQHDLLALEHLVGGLPARPFGRHPSELCLGKAIADLDGHGGSSLIAGVDEDGWRVLATKRRYGRKPSPWGSRRRGRVTFRLQRFPAT